MQFHVRFSIRPLLAKMSRALQDQMHRTLDGNGFAESAWKF